MATRRLLALALTAALGSALTGCTAAGFGWGAKGQSSAYDTTVVRQPRTSLADSIGSGFKSTTDKVAGAFTPKTIPADDPIKLSSKPEKVGPEVFLSAARLYENRGDFDAAAVQYKKAIEVSPKNLSALVAYARLRDRQGQFEDAAKYYKKAIAAHPKSATPHNDLGLCQARNGQPAAALESIQRAVQLEPENKLYRNNLATVLVDLGRSKEAFEHLTKAHGEAAAHYNLGYLLYKRDKLEPANQHFALAFEKDPSLTQARDMLLRTGGLANREVVERTQHTAPEASRPQSAPQYRLPTARGPAEPATLPTNDASRSLRAFPPAYSEEETTPGAY